MCPEQLQLWISGITALATVCLVFGVFAAAGQARAAERTLKAQTLMAVIAGWRDPELYGAVCFLHNLREKWKATASIADWSGLASEWVRMHRDKAELESLSADDRKRIDQEWMQRRIAAQFISKMGLLMQRNYIQPDDLFGVVPEAGRLLVVLIPIEREIMRYYSSTSSVAAWDRPIPKWEFSLLWNAYQKWYAQKGARLDLDVDAGRS